MAAAKPDWPRSGVSARHAGVYSSGFCVKRWCELEPDVFSVSWPKEPGRRDRKFLKASTVTTVCRSGQRLLSCFDYNLCCLIRCWNAGQQSSWWGFLVQFVLLGVRKPENQSSRRLTYSMVRSNSNHTLGTVAPCHALTGGDQLLFCCFFFFFFYSLFNGQSKSDVKSSAEDQTHSSVTAWSRWATVARSLLVG